MPGVPSTHCANENLLRLIRTDCESVIKQVLHINNSKQKLAKLSSDLQKNTLTLYCGVRRSSSVERIAIETAISDLRILIGILGIIQTSTESTTQEAERLIRRLSTLDHSVIGEITCKNKRIKQKNKKQLSSTNYSIAPEIVTDQRTGLMWQRNVVEDCFNLEAAKLYAAKLRLGRYKDWRVPTKEELLSIVDHSRRGPAIDIEVFPNTPSCWFWSVSPNARNSNHAWLVHFVDGDSSYNDVSSCYRVRCVRG